MAENVAAVLPRLAATTLLGLSTLVWPMVVSAKERAALAASYSSETGLMLGINVCRYNSSAVLKSGSVSETTAFVKR